MNPAYPAMCKETLLNAGVQSNQYEGLKPWPCYQA